MKGVRVPVSPTPQEKGRRREGRGGERSNGGLAAQIFSHGHHTHIFLSVSVSESVTRKSTG